MEIIIYIINNNIIAVLYNDFFNIQFVAFLCIVLLDFKNNIDKKRKTKSHILVTCLLWVFEGVSVGVFLIVLFDTFLKYLSMTFCFTILLFIIYIYNIYLYFRTFIKHNIMVIYDSYYFAKTLLSYKA